MVYDKSTAKPRWTAAEVEEFCGWDFLLEMVKRASLLRTKRLIASGFLLGGRINETLMGERKHIDFELDRDKVVVRAFPVIKRYEKIGTKPKWKCDGHCYMRWGSASRDRKPTKAEQARHKIVEYTGWLTKPVLAFRTFPFPKNEPLVPVLMETLNGIDGRLFDIEYGEAYQEITAIGKELKTWIPTHWFRAQRASQLALEYGFTEHDLVEWFNWTDYMTAFRYARKGYKALAAKMVRNEG